MGRGQFSAFIIVGIVLVSILSILIWTNIKSKEKDLANIDAASIEIYSSQAKSYIEECMFQLSAPAIYLQASQGGYLNEKADYGYLGQAKIAYWYKDGKDLSPSIEDLETDLANYLKDKFKVCANLEELESINGLNILKPEDYSVEAKIMINDKEVEVQFNYPLKIELNGNIKEFTQFVTRLNIPFGADYNLAKEILKSATQSKDYYDIESDCGKFSRINQLTNVYYGNGIVLINDYNTFYDNTFGETFQFRFMNEGLKVYGRCTG